MSLRFNLSLIGAFKKFDIDPEQVYEELEKEGRQV